jgi:Gram-negative porin
MNHFDRRQKVKSSIKGLVALLLVLGLAVPAMAEDRLSLTGSMQVRGFFVQDDDGTLETSHAWNDSRLRIGGKFAVADGVSVNFRFDANESAENSSDAIAWGGDTSTLPQYSNRRADIQFDQGYLMVEKNGYTLKAGEQYFGGFGITKIFDAMGAGFIVQKSGLTLAHVKVTDANKGANGLTKTGLNDRAVTGAMYDFKGDGFTLKPMVSYANNDGEDANRLALGVFGTVNAGPVGIKGELDYFNGTQAGTGFDEKGLQLYVDASMAATDTIKVGLIGLYAQGQDDTDVQVAEQNMTHFAEWHPEDYGPWSGDIVGDFETFDPTGAGAGVIGIEVYSDVKVTDDLGLQFSALYLQTEDDGIYDATGYILNASANYVVAKNTKLLTQVNYRSFEDNETDTDLSRLGVISGLVVSF